MLAVGSPYIGGVTALFEQAVAPYLSAGATTTSSTTVSPEDPPVPSSITLASATGFSTGDRVVVDVDGRQEAVTIQSLSGTTLTALFTLQHSGTYPVTVEGGESIVREKLGACVAMNLAINAAREGLGALKRAEDIEWYQAAKSANSQLSQMRSDLMELRDELASVLGVENLWRRKQAAGQRLSVY